MRLFAHGWEIGAAVLALALLSPAAARSQGGAAVTLPDSARARTLFETLEKRLLEAQTVQFTSKINSQGAVDSRFEGTVTIASGNLACVEQEGEVAGTHVAVKFTSNGKALRVDAGEKSLTVGSVGRLGEALLVAFTRLGILHQLYVLSQGRSPDWTDGTVRSHITLDGWETLGPGVPAIQFGAGWPSQATSKETGSAPPQEILHFRIRFDGALAGRAWLLLDGQTGLPARRVQEVYFGPDTMRVIETYSDFRLDEPVAPERFLVPNPR